MKTLNTIQTISKIGKILSRIIFIFSLVGAIGCAVGIVSLALIPDSLRFGGVTVHSMIEKSAEISMGECYTAMCTGLIMCAGEAVLCKFSEHYFANELQAGTPFTFEGAKEMMRLGILAIAIPFGTRVLAEISCQIVKAIVGDIGESGIEDPVSIGIGIMFIVFSLVCKYGAELMQSKAQEQ